MTLWRHDGCGLEGERIYHEHEQFKQKLEMCSRSGFPDLEHSVFGARVTSAGGGSGLTPAGWPILLFLRGRRGRFFLLSRFCGRR